ncbi:MAG: hypothetical protein QOJ99_833 [Bryobacterales bacterium]|jgi:hypothetical protein|nr:hypothetical protein [Bryobacterales bacterium]
MWATATAGLCSLVVEAETPVSALHQQGTPLIRSMTLEDFQKLVQAMGFECNREKDAAGKPESYFIFRAEGYKVVGQVPASTIISLFNIFTDKPSVETYNEWNKLNRFSRVYLDTDGNSVLEAEINLDGGVTREHIESTVKDFRDSVVRWARFVIDHSKK